MRIICGVAKNIVSKFLKKANSQVKNIKLIKLRLIRGVIAGEKYIARRAPPHFKVKQIDSPEAYAGRRRAHRRPKIGGRIRAEKGTMADAERRNNEGSPEEGAWPGFGPRWLGLGRIRHLRGAKAADSAPGKPSRVCFRLPIALLPRGGDGRDSHLGLRRRRCVGADSSNAECRNEQFALGSSSVSILSRLTHDSKLEARSSSPFAFCSLFAAAAAAVAASAARGQRRPARSAKPGINSHERREAGGGEGAKNTLRADL
jgi:hypothetical protein